MAIYATNKLRVSIWELFVRQWTDGRDVSTEADDMVGIRYQAVASENVEDFACAILRSRMCKLLKA
jgi:hypothetical protein